jgi:predicted transcriptional regulator
MALYQLKPDAPARFERAGLSQAEIARRSGITVFAVRDKFRKGQKTRGPVAWNMAKAYAREVGIGEEEALNLLFEPVEHHRTKITQAPSLTRAVTLI